MKDKIRLFEAFAGYGSQAMALKRLGVPFESIGFSEIDQYAIRAYHAVHGNVKNYGDMMILCSIMRREGIGKQIFNYRAK